MKTPIAALGLSAALTVSAEVHKWHFQSGATFDGEFVRLSGSNSVLVEKAGKQYTLPLDKLTPEDQQFAAEAKPTPEKAAPVEVFGIRLGQKYVEGMAKPVDRGHPIFGSFIEYVFTPSKPLEGFTHYSLVFRPKSKLICTVVASADYRLMDDTPYKLYSDLSRALKEKYGEPKEERIGTGNTAVELSVYTKGSLWIQLQHPDADDVQLARLAGTEPKVHIALSYGDSTLIQLKDKETPLDKQVEGLKKQL